MKSIVLILAFLVLVNCITKPNKGSDTDASLEPTKKIT